ncbi:phytanoyl-CoA dioxygenase family protein [Vibrio europaeus]|uniref:Phytanoyl-CoA dioxygenase n=1 Tax=Vibrio europaeus TaxID=300876 RepID=A0AAE7AWT4_9VIBR|nr:MULTISPECIES: phytanoyl-CoA dioxygenase family protein [Vibrio]MDD1824498.1 phytanoyl-CoA dioxygenase family protein [Photobacterium sp. ZSDE20]MDC5807801.1 phytanoyl-CoA dioxygenase family protein [Vibrio europaeus]MDC5822331.1 phytanoyl-CoA dioxygenase family protein [Vibrio europaeus]MDC5825303.1 phytanoyl-CoA dioxygenase family protein [Vibrio europaeus]MDC5832591.1 phytanoyl-CoA dioxygenase family protein [Vibrio europaeus]
MWARRSSLASDEDGKESVHVGRVRLLGKQPIRDEKTMLTKEQLEFFEQEGYVGPFDSQLSDDTIDSVANYLHEYLDKRADHPLYGRFSVREMHLLNEDVLALASQPQLVGALQQILGDDLALWRSKIFYKKPGDAAIEWHQEWGAFNGEEIGNDIPGLKPSADNQNEFWNLTIWFALQDIDESMGPMQFIRKSYKKRYPIEMVPMVDSAFWQDPFLGLESKEQLVEKCRNATLVLDINTSDYLDDIDIDASSVETLQQHILNKCAKLEAAYTCDFDYTDDELVTLPMKKGQYVIFPERTMHRSTANVSESGRMAINFRVTPSSTLIYPGRVEGDYVDGSNIDISHHKSILLSGENREPRNEYMDASDVKTHRF